MNIMLVDSDLENIKNFRAYLKGAYPDARIVGGFSDPNKDIIPVIAEWGAELIIADIKFFGGAKYMRFKDIHDIYPDIRFIVYGTFNETDYMKRAREFGVLDFMFRPVKPGELSRCMEEASKHFKKREEAQQRTQVLTQNYQERLFHYEDIFLRSLLKGRIKNGREITDGLAYFNIALDPAYCVCVVRIDHFNRVAADMHEKDKHLLIFQILNIVHEHLKDYRAQAFITAFHAVAVILCGQHTIKDKVTLFDSIKHAISEKTDTRVTVGIGRAYDDPTRIRVSYGEAKAAFGYRHILGYNSVIQIEFAEPESSAHEYPRNWEDKLIRCAVVGDLDTVRQILYQLRETHAQSGGMAADLPSCIAMSVMARLMHHIYERNMSIASQAADAIPYLDIRMVQTIEEAYSWLDDALQRFCAFIGSWRQKESEALLEAAKAYGRDHYSETFTIVKAATHLSTTPEHINRIFLEREGSTFFDHIMYVRVHEAQLLLRDTDLDEETVASNVGFDDVRYFRSIFKKYEGEMPAEYRGRVKG